MRTKPVNVYDFDHTIYDGDASFDFILYNFLKSPKLWSHTPSMISAIIGYIFGRYDRKEVKQIAFSFVKDVKDIDLEVDRFWKKYANKLSPWYLEKKQTTDIIVSASPEFLLRPVSDDLNVGLIATRMDKKTGAIRGENCRGSEKVTRLKRYDASLVIGEAFSDSLSDLPFLQKAKHAYIVRKQTIVNLKDYKPSKLIAFKNRKFFRFLVVGGLNAFVGVLFSYLIALSGVHAIASFIIGYALSLMVSYFLNSTIAFRNFQFSVKQFISFIVSYIPNFVIQLFLVFVLIGILNIYPLIGYIVAVIIGVPITFLLLSKRTFKEVRDE